MSAEPTKPTVARVRAIASEPTTFEVLSSNGKDWYKVDLKEHHGCGRCSCIRWETVSWPIIRDTQNLPPSKRCRHLRASRELYCSTKLLQEIASE